MNNVKKGERGPDRNHGGTWEKIYIVPMSILGGSVAKGYTNAPIQIDDERREVVACLTAVMSPEIW